MEHKALNYDLRLDCSLEVYIPTCNAEGKIVDTLSSTKKIHYRMNTLLGGAVVSSCMANWTKEDGSTINETMYYLLSYTKENLLQHHVHEIVGMCMNLKKSLGIDEIPIKINGNLQIL